MGNVDNKVPAFLTETQRSIINKDIEKPLIYQINGFDYVNHNVIINILNKAFDYSWNWTIIDKGIEETHTFKRSRINGGNNEEYRSYYAWVLGELSYPVFTADSKNPIWIKKQAFGGKPLIGEAKVQSQTYKSASSDALKKAASILGIAKNVYMDEKVYKQIMEEESAYDSWTDENQILYRDQLEILKEFQKSCGDSDKFIEHVNAFCRETLMYSKLGQITPSNIGYFIDYLDEKNLLAAAPESSQDQNTQTNKAITIFS